MKASPGGVGDGLPALPSGEPLLARWFVIMMLILVPIGIAVSLWAFLSSSRPELGAAARRPPGTTEYTHERGAAALNATTDLEPGPDCAQSIELFGDTGARSAGNRTLGAVCQLLRDDRLALAQDGLREWARDEGVLRFAVFEVTGLDSSTRIEDGRTVIELNAKFQFEDSTEAAPFVIHELIHLAGGDWPAAPVTDTGELRALEAQQVACAALAFRNEPPRGCDDADELVEDPDPLARLDEAGYRPGR